ncbi:Glycine-rich RNA-binding protein 3 [Raphanus sativus]|nr:Glycine-rich RNA-binding protein 3 [Raphanus sativus]
MAFLSKFGNVLKQTTSKQLNAHGSLSRSPSLFKAIRCMSSSKLFIGGMEYGMNEDSLREAFSKYGEVVGTRVILDRETGRSRGFGFVTFTDAEAASSAIQALDGQDLHGRIVKVSAVGGYNGSSGYDSGNTYGINNGGFAGDSQFSGNPVGNSSQFGGENTQFGVGGGEAQFGGMENTEMENGPVGGFEDDTDVAKRA